MNRANKEKYWAIGFCLLILFFSVFWVWRIHYGTADILGPMDESFYLEIPYRMLYGDVLLQEETFSAQMFAFILFPIMKLWKIIKGTDTEGIILCFRYIWVFFHILTAVILFMLLKRKSIKIAVISSSFYVSYCICSVMAISYNTIALSCITIIIALMLGEYNSCFSYLFQGLLLSALVLCNPYCIMLYFILLAFIIKNDIERKIKIQRTALLHIGILLLLIPFLFHVLSDNHNLFSVINNALNIALSDPSHVSGQILSSKYLFVIEFASEFPLFICIYLILFFVRLVSKNISRLTTVLIMHLCTYTTIYAAYKYHSSSTMMFIIFVGLWLFIFEKDLRTTVFKNTGLVAIIFIFCTNLCSNTALFAVSWACIPGAIISWFIIDEYLNKDEGVSLYTKNLLVVGMASIVVSCATYTSISSVYFDNRITELTSTLQEGPLKGIHTTSEKADIYESILSDISNITFQADDKVIFFPGKPMDYLYLERENCYPKYWYNYNGFSDPEFTDYYKRFPQKKPNVVILDLRNATENINNLAEDLDYSGYEKVQTSGCYSVYRLTKNN